MQTSGPLRGKFASEDFRHHGARRNLRVAEFHLLAREQAQFFQFAQQVIVAGIAQRLLETLAHSSFKCLRQGRRSTRSMERDQRRESRNVKILGLGQRIDRGQLAFAQDACRFHIFVDQPLHREHELIVKRRRRLFRQTANIKPQRVGAAAQPPDQFSAQNRGHSRRQPAIRRNRDSTLLGFFRKRQFLPHDGVVAPRSAKWQRASTAARASPRFRKYGTAESAASCPRISFAAAFSLLASSTTARTFLPPVMRLTRAATSRTRLESLSARVTESTCGRARHIERRCRAHHAGTNH